MGKRMSVPSWKPSDWVSPRFSRILTIKAGVELKVTFSTGSVTMPPKKLPWIDSRFFIMVVRTPASPPLYRSARRKALASVCTLPTRNARYNSFKVGARKER